MAEQLCYIPCNYCNIVLAVSVPCSSMFDIVTVRCGHCTNLLSVNMASAFQTQAYVNSQQLIRKSSCSIVDSGSSSSKCSNNKITARAPYQITPQERVVNRPPEKRQRVPSAYNQFIEEEIQRIKANKPDISHREAFSTAAKNWAHFPRIQFGLMPENSHGAKLDEGIKKHQLSKARPY